MVDCLTFKLDNTRVLIQNLHIGNFHHLFVARQKWAEFREVAERLKAHAWKACIGATLSGVRIPPHPPFHQDAITFALGHSSMSKAGQFISFVLCS